MNDACVFGGVVLALAVSVAWAVWATCALWESGRRRREDAYFKAVLQRSEDFKDEGVANHAARFLAEAARRRSEERAANLKEAAK